MKTTNTQVTEATITATITRADGTVEHLGVIDTYKRRWYRTLLQKLPRRG